MDTNPLTQGFQTLVALVTNNPSMKNVVKARLYGKNNGSRRTRLPAATLFSSTHFAKWLALAGNKHLNIDG